MNTAMKLSCVNKGILVVREVEVGVDVQEGHQDTNGVDNIDMDQPLEPCLPCISDQPVIEAMKRQPCECRR